MYASSVITAHKDFLDESLVKLYGSKELSEYRPILQQLNAGQSQSVCAKKLGAGDVAWKCEDCQKDRTAIICNECFELSDHAGHKFILRREVSGCCDCGDDDAWMEKGFCKNHQGKRAQNAREVIEKMPATMRRSAISVFDEVMKKLKVACLRMQNAETLCLKTPMSEALFKDSYSSCIVLIFQFFGERIRECPAFIHVLDQAFTKIYIDNKSFVKNEHHTQCCTRYFLDGDEEAKQEFEDVFMLHSEQPRLCSCSTLDLCMQTNHLLAPEGLETVYSFFLEMFQSYHFKQSLTLSYASNYHCVQRDPNRKKFAIAFIGVQALTSKELSDLIYCRKELLLAMTAEFEMKLSVFAGLNSDAVAFQNLMSVLHDFRYMSKQKEGALLPLILGPLTYVYFLDKMPPRTEMIQFEHEDGFNRFLIGLEFELVVLYDFQMEGVDFKSDKVKPIFQAFFNAFERIKARFVEEKLHDHGHFVLPVHRMMAPALARLLLENGCGEGLKAGLQTRFRAVIGSQLEPGQSVDSALHSLALPLVKHMSFVYEVASRKWVYYGERMNRVIPNVLTQSIADTTFLQRNYGLMQMALCCDNLDTESSGQTNMEELSGEYKPLIELVIQNYGTDGQL